MSSGSPVPPLRRCTFPLATSTKLSVHACEVCVTFYSTVFSLSYKGRGKILSDESVFLGRRRQRVISFRGASHKCPNAFEIEHNSMHRVRKLQQRKSPDKPQRQVVASRGSRRD